MEKRIIIDCSTGQQTEENFEFIPHVFTKTQKIVALNTEYDPVRKKLRDDLAYINAYYPGDATKYNAAKLKLDNCNAEYSQKMGVIMIGG